MYIYIVNPSVSLSGLLWQKKPEIICNAEDPLLISGAGRSPGEENGNPFHILFGKFHGQRILAIYRPWGHRVRHNLETKPLPYLYLFICTHMHTHTHTEKFITGISPCDMETEKSYNLTICYLQSLPEKLSLAHSEIKCHLIPGHLVTQSSGHIQVTIKIIIWDFSGH